MRNCITPPLLVHPWQAWHRLGYAHVHDTIAGKRPPMCIRTWKCKAHAIPIRWELGLNPSNGINLNLYLKQQYTLFHVVCAHARTKYVICVCRATCTATTEPLFRMTTARLVSMFVCALCAWTADAVNIHGVTRWPPPLTRGLFDFHFSSKIIP